MTRLFLAAPLTAAALALADATTAQSSITPLATFGSGGWLAPGSSAFLNTGSTERGFAYNPMTGNLVLVSRAGGNNVRVLDGATGADLGGLDTTGIAGGTFAVNMAGVGDDGAIYVGNLAIGAANFKVYKWASEATGATTPPSVAYDDLITVSRVGDSFAVEGGANAQFAAGGSATASNSNFLNGTLDGSNTGTTYASIPGTTTTSNDFRLGVTFLDGDTVIGNQGGNARVVSFNGTTAMLDATIPLNGAAQRPLDYAIVGGVPVLAVVDTNSSLVQVFDLSLPTAPVLLAAGNATSGTLAGNGNGVGSCAWGAIVGDTATLYAMSTNQGIQAFTVVVQPSASATPFGTGCGTPALTLTASGAPLLPSSIQLTSDNLPATANAGFYLYGFVAIEAGQAVPFGAPGCLQHVQILATRFVPTGGASSVAVTETYPNDPSFAGLPIFVQSAFIDTPSAILTTNGLRLLLQTF
ncbi:MAG: hypothetical protein KDE27_27350 [Planctomycetes bacterium]|nr:hypothetical protein [Planctomycetota bacterium]